MFVSRTRLASTLAATLLVVSLASPSQAAGPAQQSARSTSSNASGAVQARGSRVVCVQYVFTGSRLPRKDCRTEANWLRDIGEIPTNKR